MLFGLVILWINLLRRRAQPGSNVASMNYRYINFAINHVSIDELAQIPPVNDPLPHSLDDMCMTPLHILSCNPHATFSMIRDLACKCPFAAFVRNKFCLNPLDMYLIKKSSSHLSITLIIFIILRAYHCC